MEIEIKVTFFGGKGHCNVTIIVSDYETTEYASSRSFFFELESGSYNIQLQGVSPKRVLVEVVNPDGKVIGEKNINKEGNFMRSLNITI